MGLIFSKIYNIRIVYLLLYVLHLRIIVPMFYVPDILSMKEKQMFKLIMHMLWLIGCSVINSDMITELQPKIKNLVIFA